MKRSPTAFEQEVLDVLLVELRRAMKLGDQLQITIDPWTNPKGGAYIFAAPNSAGRTYTIEAPVPKRRGRR